MTGTLPDGIAALRAAARSEGHRFLERLAADWEAGAMRFNRPGEMLLAAQLAGVLAGIGGLTLDPVMPGALRMRRFYIHPAFRRQGIGRTLSVALLQQSSSVGLVLTVNAGTRDAPVFWEALDFVPDAQDGHTHIRRPRQS